MSPSDQLESLTSCLVKLRASGRQSYSSAGQHVRRQLNMTYTVNGLIVVAV